MGYLRNEKGFFTMIGILLALALMCFFVYIVINAYFAPLSANKSNTGLGGPANPAAGNVKSIVGSTKDIIKDVNRKSIEQYDEVEKALNK